MQWHYNEHCLGLGRQALILHGSHREREPFKTAEDPCYHSPPEVLALPLLSKKAHLCLTDWSYLARVSFEIQRASEYQCS